MKIGVLALQGDFREHLHAIAHCGEVGIEVRRASELDICDALILPGENRQRLRCWLTTTI